MEKETVRVVESKTKRSFYYGYIIVVLSFMAMVAAMGIRGTFGTYVTEWEQTFSVNRFGVSLVSFISLFVYGVSVVWAGRLSDQIGPRKVLTFSMVLLSVCMIGSYYSTNIWHMVFLYGIIGSIGFGFASNITVSVAIVRWFKEKKGLMISIVVVGMAAGPMIYGPMNLFLIKSIGWKTMFVIYGAVYAIILLPLFATFYKDYPKDDLSVPKISNKESFKRKIKINPLQSLKSIFSIFRYPITWLITFTYIICGFTDVGLIYTHLVPLGENKGFSTSVLGNVMFVYGITNIIGTILIGYISDKFSNQKLISFLFMVRGFALVLLIFVDQPLWMIVFALLYGFTDIATIAPFTVMCSKIFGEKQMGTSFGLISFFHQFGAALGSLVPGLLFSLSGNYQSSLWISTGLLMVSAIILFKLKVQRQVSE